MPSLRGYHKTVPPTLRRLDLSPRLELTPLIDVVFLLLTFFVISLTVMIEVDVLPLELSRATAGPEGQAGPIRVLSIDRDGGFLIDGESVDDSALDEKLIGIAQDPEQPTLYVLMEAGGDVDRGPLAFELPARLQSAGITRVVQVSPKQTGDSP